MTEKATENWIKKAAREIFPDNNEAFEAIGISATLEVAAFNAERWKEIEEVIARNVPQPQILVPQGSAPDLLTEINRLRIPDENSSYIVGWNACLVEVLEMLKRLAARDVPQSKPEDAKVLGTCAYPAHFGAHRKSTTCHNWHSDEGKI